MPVIKKPNILLVLEGWLWLPFCYWRASMSWSDSIGADRPKGTVKWFNSQKGFGFIQPQGGGKDVFVRHLGSRASGVERPQ